MKIYDALFNLEKGFVPLEALDKELLQKVLDTYGYPYGLQRMESPKNAENLRGTGILKDVFATDKRHRHLKSKAGKNIEIDRQSLFEVLFEKQPCSQSLVDKQYQILVEKYRVVTNRLRHRMGGRLMSRSQAHEAVQHFVTYQLKHYGIYRG